METDVYYKIHHVDGRVENFHFNSVNENIDWIIDSINEIRKKGNKIFFLKKNDYLREGYSKDGIINIHLDLSEPNDANGEKIGYMEYYIL